MPDFTIKDLKDAAGMVLAMEPDPIPRFRLLRDVLKLDPADSDYIEAEQNLQGSKWVRQLRQAQQPDGTWGRFHSQDSHLKQPFPTTESAISIALDCGQAKTGQLLQKTLPVLESYVSGTASWPDPAEKHDNPLAWYEWVRHFSAAVLSLLDRCHPLLDEYWNLWAEAVEAAFAGGTYDRTREIKALNRLFNCRMKDPIPFHKKYPLLILSSTKNALPEKLERKVLAFVLHHPAGIYYVYGGDISQMPAISSRAFWPWLQAHRLLSRFRLWPQVCEAAIQWTWDQRGGSGLWEVGDKTPRKPFTSLPLSESWRRPENRGIDGSVEVLSLLTRALEGNLPPT